MKLVTETKLLRSTITQWRQQGHTIAFAPTMGNLHQGHMSLVERAQTVGDKTVVSIFVNPLQFGPDEDLAAYPRTPEQDQRLLAAAGVDLLFYPDVKTMYPRPMTEHTTVSVPHIGDQLCGANRPGHFQGVATVVSKLFNLVQADYAVFGEKDYQQLLIIRQMVEDLAIPVTIIGQPVHREESGLAMSSRNGYLSAAQKQEAAFLFNCLSTVAGKLNQGSNDYTKLEKEAIEKLQAKGFNVDYFKIVNKNNLLSPEPEEKHLVIMAAAYYGKPRLIDNVIVER